MKNKSVKLLVLILILSAALLMTSGCGKSGSRFKNVLPTIKITSYGGWADDHLLTEPYQQVFQQKIFWHATDEDGVINGYAFRVLDEDGNPLATPGYEYIARAEDKLIPKELLESMGEGWVLHYMAGADDTYPLDDPKAKRTIWSSKKYAVINFPAADEEGNPTVTKSRFEVIAIDNRGGITPVPAYREFLAHSEVPQSLLSTSRGNPNSNDVGSGIKLSFLMRDFDPYVLEIPDEYLFRIKKLSVLKVDDGDGKFHYDVQDTLSTTDWYSTKNQEKIDRYLLTGKTDPKLEYDYDENGAFKNTMTVIESRVRDMAGVMSIHPNDADTTHYKNLAIKMTVKPGFYPHTVFYSQKVYGVGDHHYDYWRYADTQEELPSLERNDGIANGTAFFKDMNNRNTIVYSPNLKVYARWGWFGEFAQENQAGNLTPILDDPFIIKVDDVLFKADDEDLRGTNYYSEITHFDLRYDGAAFDFPPYRNQVWWDDEGKDWLRVDVHSVLGQSLVLTADQVLPGTHKLEVRCVDMQDKYSEVPAVWEFDVVEYIPPAQRSGVLIVNDGKDNSTLSPRPYVLQFYKDLALNAGIPESQIGTIVVENLKPDFAGRKTRKLAFSDLMKYKLVIYNSDNPAQGAGGEFVLIDDALTLYMQRGGNLIISHTSHFKPAIDEIFGNVDRYRLMAMLGLSSLSVGTVTGNQYYLQKANPEASGYQVLNVQYGEGDDASFNRLVNSNHGYNEISYFKMKAADESVITSGDRLYSYGCKPVDYEVRPPTQEVYDQLNGRTIAYRHINPSYQNSRAYVFGIPLSYMKPADAKATFNKIWSELM